MRLYKLQGWSKTKILNIGKGLVEYMQRPDTKWLGGYCGEQGFHRTRLSAFAEEYPEFKKYLEKAKQLQEDKLINLVIENNTNATFIIFLLKNISRDLTDKQNVEISGELKQKIAHGDIKKMSKDQLREFLRAELSKE